MVWFPLVWLVVATWAREAASSDALANAASSEAGGVSTTFYPY